MAVEYSNIEQMAVQKLGGLFLAKTKLVCQQLGFPYTWLMCMMYHESQFTPSLVNPNGGASGITQFMPPIITQFGISIEAYRKLSGEKQLDYVKKYYDLAKNYGGIKTPEDFYLFNLSPIAINKPDDYVIGLINGVRFAQTVARGNKGDLNKDDKIEVGEFKKYIRDTVYSEFKNLPKK